MKTKQSGFYYRNRKEKKIAEDKKQSIVLKKFLSKKNCDSSVPNKISILEKATKDFSNEEEFNKKVSVIMYNFVSYNLFFFFKLILNIIINFIFS